MASSRGRSHSYFLELLTNNSLYRRGDLRTRDDRVQKVVNSWRNQLPTLIDAYLSWKDVGSKNSDDVPGAWPLAVIGLDGTFRLTCGRISANLILERGMHLFSHCNTSSSANETLVLHGFLGCAPSQPALAFPLRLFEIYRQLHRVCPRFSLDALSKTLTHLHYVYMSSLCPAITEALQGPRKSALQSQLSTAYDAYLEIIRGVDARARIALGRSGRWYMDNVCPPCLYKTIDEPALKFSFLAAVDGNNSLKSVATEFKAGAPRADDRITRGIDDRWLTPEEVNVFKDEVTNSQKVCFHSYFHYHF
jgi:hypothetical protein